jgi:hypothetical protein
MVITSQDLLGGGIRLDIVFRVKVRASAGAVRYNPVLQRHSDSNYTLMQDDTLAGIGKNLRAVVDRTGWDRVGDACCVPCGCRLRGLTRAFMLRPQKTHSFRNCDASLYLPSLPATDLF